MVSSFHPTTSLCSPYVAFGSVSTDDTKIIEELVVSLFKTVSSFKNVKQSYPRRSVFVYFAIAVQGVWP